MDTVALEALSVNIAEVERLLLWPVPTHARLSALREAASVFRDGNLVECGDGSLRAVRGACGQTDIPPRAGSSMADRLVRADAVRAAGRRAGGLTRQDGPA